VRALTSGRREYDYHEHYYNLLLASNVEYLFGALCYFMKSITHCCENGFECAGAVEFLQMAGFAEGKGAGGSDCFVLKTSDPGLLWLALSVLQPFLA